VAKYLKTYPEKCTGCGICMDVCSETFFKEKNPLKSAIKIEPQEGSFLMTVCNQTCRLCVDECPVQALTVNPAGVVLLNKNKCIGCLACVSVCPINAMMWYEGAHSPFKCIACGKCADACPTQALEIVEEG